MTAATKAPTAGDGIERNRSGQHEETVVAPPDTSAVQLSFGERMRAYRAQNPVRRPAGPKHAETPQIRESGSGLVGVGLSARTKVTPPRMAKILHRMGCTLTQFKDWSGFSTADWARDNPSWTERQFFEILSENLDTIREAL